MRGDRVQPKIWILEKYPDEFHELQRKLAGIGRHYRAPSELFSGGKLDRETVDLLLRELPTITNETLADGVVRGLMRTMEGYDGRPLCALFEHAKSDNLRWVIAECLGMAKPRNVQDWLYERTASERVAMVRASLLWALSRYISSRDDLRRLLRELFEANKEAVAQVLARTGDESDLAFVKRALSRQDLSKNERKELALAEKRLDRRLSRARRSLRHISWTGEVEGVPRVIGRWTTGVSCECESHPWGLVPDSACLHPSRLRSSNYASGRSLAIPRPSFASVRAVGPIGGLMGGRRARPGLLVTGGGSGAAVGRWRGSSQPQPAA
jgi:hypothetical protein